MIYLPLPIGRVCHRCNTWKPYSELRKSRGSPDGVRHLCLSCKNERDRQRYLLDPVKVLEYKKRYNETHREQRREIKRRDYKKRKTAHIEYGKAWKRANIERVRETRRRSEHKRNAQKHSLPTEFSSADWEYCLKYFDYKCAYCGRPRGLWHTLAMDHFVPVARGGRYTPDNIVPACHSTEGGEGSCNNSKSFHDPVKWLTEHFGKRKAKQILKRIQAYFAHVLDLKP